MSCKTFSSPNLWLNSNLNPTAQCCRKLKLVPTKIAEQVYTHTYTQTQTHHSQCQIKKDGKTACVYSEINCVCVYVCVCCWLEIVTKKLSFKITEECSVSAGCT